MMLKKFLILLVLVFGAVSASAQERPLSPPERAPVPLTNDDQERARVEELKKIKAADAAALKQGTQIKVPAALTGHHISSGNTAIDALVQEAAGRAKGR